MLELVAWWSDALSSLKQLFMRIFKKLDAPSAADPLSVTIAK